MTNMAESYSHVRESVSIPGVDKATLFNKKLPWLSYQIVLRDSEDGWLTKLLKGNSSIV